MNKIIKGFRREDYGLFIDLEDTPASVAANPGTWEIILDVIEAIRFNQHKESRSFQQ